MREQSRPALSAISILILGVLASAARAEPPAVHEVTMAAPDIVRIEVREAPVHPGAIVKLAAPVPGDDPSYTLSDGRRGVVIGPRRDHLRVADRADIAPLDRKAVDRASAYGAVGGHRVTAVHRKSVPWSSGKLYKHPFAKNVTPVVSFAHFIYLQLDGALRPGGHSITWPDAMLPPTSFTIDDRVTRASSIHATQLGHRPGDDAKYAYLSLWLPDGPDDGAVDFRRYGLRRFEVVDADGKAAFAGEIALRAGPTDVEPGDGLPGTLVVYTRADGSTYRANRAGTYVFALDYGAWRNPKPGTYRIRIPGLGVSDPFEIADDIWHRAAQASMAGLYHQRSGLALDGRFGYTRPECFTEASGITVYQSKLPVALTIGRGAIVKFQEGGKAPWLTGRTLPDAWGGYQDAGDWDRNMAHISASYMLLDLFEQLPDAAKRMAFGTPASGAVLPHPLYKGKDLPDLVDEAVWNLDFFRRLQRTDGAVSGGIESAGGPRNWQPSWLESLRVFAFAPDPDATYAYAAGAAKLAIVLKRLGEAPLSALYADSARKAWAWAERATADPDIAFSEARAILGPDNPALAKRLDQIRANPSDYRLWAAATLFRLTGEARFDEVVVDRFAKKQALRSLRADAAWEYLSADWPDRNKAVLWQTERALKALAANDILKDQAKNTYKSLKHGHAPMGWGEGTAPSGTEAMGVIRAYRLTGDKKYIAAMQDASAHILGANQIGMSFTTGLGRRWPQSPLHEDSIAAGVPAPKGITIYGWAPFHLANDWWLFKENWAALSDEVPTRRIEPFRASMPVYEYLIDYPRVIVSAEYTVAQTITTTAVLWAFLDGHDRGKSGAPAK
jgi:endoglucanase